ncbi:hypothetical protein GCM10027414_21510 [Humibacter ginsengiterrae]
MTETDRVKFVKLRDSGETIADRGSDIRGRRVIDKDDQTTGKVDALLLDEKEQKIRFLEVAHGGFLGLGRTRSFLPVDAITTITDEEVHIDQTAQNLAGAPIYDPELVDEVHFFEETYGYYGFPPFWGGTMPVVDSIRPRPDGGGLPVASAGGTRSRTHGK